MRRPSESIALSPLLLRVRRDASHTLRTPYDAAALIVALEQFRQGRPVRDHCT